MSNWPKRADGSNMTIGEMTTEQKRAVIHASCQRLKEHFEKPAVQAGIQVVLDALIGEEVPTGFDTYINEQIEKGNTELADRMMAERRMARALVDAILDRGFTVTVSDGEDRVVKKSIDRAEIMGALSSTDEDYVYVTDGNGRDRAWFRLIYGNSGWDVVSDYSANELGDAIWNEVLSPLSDKIEAGI